VWDGALRIDGGEVVQTPYLSPEITSMTPAEVTWRNTSRSFGSLYGAQRGGIEITLAGPDTAVVTVGCGDRNTTVTLSELARPGRLEIPGALGHFRIQQGIGGLCGLGRRQRDLEWTDDSTEPAFYYVRVFQIDGEMAWSSPIWVTSPGRAGR